MDGGMAEKSEPPELVNCKGTLGCCAISRLEGGGELRSAMSLAPGLGLGLGDWMWDGSWRGGVGKEMDRWWWRVESWWSVAA